MIPNRPRQEQILINKQLFNNFFNYFFFLQVFPILNHWVLLAFIDNSDPQRSLDFTLELKMVVCINACHCNMAHHSCFVLCTSVRRNQVLVNLCITLFLRSGLAEQLQHVISRDKSEKAFWNHRVTDTEKKRKGKYTYHSVLLCTYMQECIDTHASQAFERCNNGEGSVAISFKSL